MTQAFARCKRCNHLKPAKAVDIWRGKWTCTECRDNILKAVVGLVRESTSVVNRAEVE